MISLEELVEVQRPIPALTEGVSASASMNHFEHKVFAFTAEQNGIYKISFEGSGCWSSSCVGSNYEFLWVWAYPRDDFEVMLDAGKTYCLITSSYISEGDFSVQVDFIREPTFRERWLNPFLDRVSDFFLPVRQFFAPIRDFFIFFVLPVLAIPFMPLIALFEFLFR